MNLEQILETLLFVADRPLKPEDVAVILEMNEAEVETAFQALTADYASRGLQIIKVAHGYQLCTRPEFSDHVHKLLRSPVMIRLSPAALETLAIIAYKQPVTKIEVETIRGVISDSPIETLIEKEMVTEKGRGEGVGRPILYTTTEKFLREFGLENLDQMPPLPEGKPDDLSLYRMSQIVSEEEVSA